MMRAAILPLVLMMLSNLCYAANVTPTAKEFAAEGKNRAAIAVERPPFDDRLDTSSLLGTQVKRADALRLPDEPEYLYQTVDPVPLASLKVAAPWLGHFKQSMVFVIGHLDPARVKLARWAVRILDDSGTEVRSFSGVGNPPEAFTWNGRDREFNPVPMGRAYVPELTLIDFYGAKVSLPQRAFVLDQFLWEEPVRLTAGLLQDTLFARKGAKFSPDGGMIMRELSHLLDQNGSVVLEITCAGPDADLCADRARALKEYFARENLALRKIEARAETVPGEATLTFKARKLAAP